MEFTKIKKGYYEISRLVLNPLIKELKLNTYSAFVLDVLYNVNDPIGQNEIIIKICKKFYFDEISNRIVNDTLIHLVELNYITRYNSKYYLTDDYQKKMEEDVSRTERDYQKMCDSFVNEVQKIYGSILDDYQKHFVTKALENSIFDILDNISQSTVNYIENIDPHIDVKHIKQLIIENASLMNELIIDNAEKIKNTLPEAIENIFRNPPDSFSKGLLMCGHKHVMWRILGVDPELKKYRTELFKDVSVLLDTNILIASLCEGSTRHNHTIWTLESTKKLGIKLFISDLTLTEYGNSVNYADYLYEQNFGKKINSKMLENEIAKTYYHLRNKYTDWVGYITKMKQGADIFIKTWDVSIVRSSDYNIDPKDISDLKTILQNLFDSDLERKPETIFEHDAINVLLVQKLRKMRHDASFKSPWFITHHYRLINAEPIIKKRLKYSEKSCMSCEVWFELIYPFIWTDVDPLTTAKAFTDLISSSILPIETPSASQFVTYIATELQLPVEDENIIKRIIEDSHLHRVLEKDLEKGDYSVALDTFSKIIGDKLDAERKIEGKERIITRLVDKIRSLQGLNGKTELFKSDSIIATDVIVKIHPDIAKLIREAQQCYDIELYDQCAVTLRKAIDNAMYLRFKIDGKLNELKINDQSVDLPTKINKARDADYISSKQASELRKVKWLGDAGAHDYRIKIRKSDIYSHLILFRLFFEAIFHGVEDKCGMRGK